MREGLGEIGKRNVAFARKFLSNENIPVLGEDVGGTSARRIEFRPAAGLSRCKVVHAAPPEKIAMKPPPASVGDVELF
jgi:chemotaxis protein CheD